EEWPTDVKPEDVKDEMIEAKEELSESESVKPEDVKDELYEEVKDEIKEEVKEESDEDEELYDSSKVKSEVKEECKEEVKQEPGVYDSNWIKSECKEEFKTKVKKEPTIKREPPDGFSEARQDTPGKRQAKFASNVAGVWWTESSKSWEYALRDKGKYLERGKVKAKDASEAEIFGARAEAEEKMNKLNEKYGLPCCIWGADKEVKSASELVQRESGVLGVTWRPTEGCWLTQVNINCRNTLLRVRPKDETPEEVERCLQECVAAMRELKARKACEEKRKT
ncbi:unnamed protein product, partial [Polarella glacialis]